MLKLRDSCSANTLVENEPNVSYTCSRYYRAPELIFGATSYTRDADFLNSPSPPMFFRGQRIQTSFRYCSARCSAEVTTQQAGWLADRRWRRLTNILESAGHSPAFETQAPAWSSLDTILSNPGAIGQERRTPMSSFHGSGQLASNFRVKSQSTTD